MKLFERIRAAFSSKGPPPSDAASSSIVHPLSFPVFVTTYGYPGDTTPDSNSANGIGAWDNRLGPLSLAVSRDVEAGFVKAGIKPRTLVVIRLADGREITKRWDDRTARSYKGKPLTGRFDFYSPDGKNPWEGEKVVGFGKGLPLPL